MCPLMRTSSSACNREAMGMPCVFTDLLATRSWAKGCQMRPSAKAAEKPEDKADPKESSEARNERPGPKTGTQANGEASKTTTSTNDNPSSLSGLLADLTPLFGPIQAEQLSQLLTQIQWRSRPACGRPIQWTRPTLTRKTRKIQNQRKVLTRRGASRTTQKTQKWQEHWLR